MNIQQLLLEKQVDFILLDDPINIFYFTKIHFSSARLLLSADHPVLFVDFRYQEKAESLFQGQVIAHKNVDEALSSFLKTGSKIGFSSDRVVVDRLNRWKEIPNVEWLPLSNLIAPLRLIKHQEEIAKIQEACALTHQGFLFLKGLLQEGITEKKLAKELEVFFLQHGADGVAFPPIIAFGEHSAIPHHSPTNRALKKGDIVQFDIGCKKENYCSDFSRIHFFGEPHPKLVAIEHIVKHAKLSAEKKARDGVLIQEFDQAARDVINEEGYGENFLHSLGHGLGLEIHEAPLIKQSQATDRLKKGMVITIEPGIYIQGLGGVRLEDTYLITSSDPINLSAQG